jgi:hypothetical protein
LLGGVESAAAEEKKRATTNHTKHTKKGRRQENKIAWATAVLMEAFVAEVTAAAGQGKKLPYAQALRQARLKVRARADWAGPFYWAPFVLLGPPE